MPDPFIGQIQPFGFNFAPRGWAKCDGQLLAISSNTALFSLLGTIYGGDGRTTFALPDLRGRVGLHAGNGPGLSNRVIGEKSGAETVTLNTQQMPSHNHTVGCTNQLGNQGAPEGQVMSAEDTNAADIYHDGAPDKTMNAAAISDTGGNQAHNNMQPYQVINYIIALQGTFPSRN